MHACVCVQGVPFRQGTPQPQKEFRHATVQAPPVLLGGAGAGGRCCLLRRGHAAEQVVNVPQLLSDADKLFSPTHEERNVLL